MWLRKLLFFFPEMFPSIKCDWKFQDTFNTIVHTPPQKTYQTYPAIPPEETNSLHDRNTLLKFIMPLCHLRLIYSITASN